MLERIYIGRRFKNDTERLEKLFELYTTMTAKTAARSGWGSKMMERLPACMTHIRIWRVCRGWWLPEPLLLWR